MNLLAPQNSIPMDFRFNHTTEWRAKPIRHTIDAGFVHIRKIETILGEQGMTVIDDQIRKLPGDLPGWQLGVRLDHIYARTMLRWCEVNKVKCLGDVLAYRRGRIFCSNVELGPADSLGGPERVKNPVLVDGNYEGRVELHYSRSHVHGDTPKERLRDGGYVFSVIAELAAVKEDVVIFDPIVMGTPWLTGEDDEPYEGLEWYASEFYEVFVEDFDQFTKVREIALPTSPNEMSSISESAFKTCVADILGDKAQKDWGGETSDYYTAHLSINGKRTTGAFAFKGSARFAPMGLNHLGKNNDQIVRLAEEPADVLFVQHCHDILPAVRKTLRAFAVQPSYPRRYCLIDGRDSLRLLKAYGLYDKALSLSRRS